MTRFKILERIDEVLEEHEEHRQRVKDLLAEDGVSLPDPPPRKGKAPRS